MKYNKKYSLFFIFCSLLYKKQVVFCFVLFIFFSCSLTKYVPHDKTLLNRVKIKKIDASEPSIQTLNNYVLQPSNSYMLGFIRARLAIYNMSGSDTTKWSNRVLRKIGEEPVIFDQMLIENSQNAIHQALKNKGYLHSNVSTYIKTKRRKTDVTFNVFSGTSYKIGHYDIDIKDDSVKILLSRVSIFFPLVGKNFDVDILNENRNRVAQIMRRTGYYNVQKEHFAYTADTTGKNYVDLKLVLQEQYAEDSVSKIIFKKKRIDKVTIYCFSDNKISQESYLRYLDTVEYNGYRVIYNHKNHIFTPKFLTSKTMLIADQLYNERMVERTNTNLSNLSSIKYINIGFTEKENDMLDCAIFISPSDKYSYSIEVEGTNSNGDLGAGLKAGFVDKNLFHGGEVLRIGASAAYEAMRHDSILYHSYNAGGEANLTVPQILLPFFNENFRKRYGGSTVFSINYSYQNLPKWYRRSIANASMSFFWQQRFSKYTFNLIDLSYIYLPWRSDNFKERYMKPTSSMRYSYENHLITRIGFGYLTTNRRSETSTQNFYTFRASIKTAGNLMYGLSKLTKQKKNEDGVYEVFKTPYSQFVKGDADYTYNRFINEKTKIVLHAALGIGFPYGNASIMPYEERYYCGGANSLRGWNMRNLGPGSYKSPVSDRIYFMNQSGDIKLEMNAEVRFKLFWVLEFAAFVDAGNIWTIKNYPEQAGGVFLFTKRNVEKYNRENLKYAIQNGGDGIIEAPNSCAPFYEQIACSYGIGLRADFSFFIIRFDMGIKLYDPKYTSISDRWRTSLSFKNDVSFCFAVGYPF
jgi:outer membrane protein assembly factor BamA